MKVRNQKGAGPKRTHENFFLLVIVATGGIFFFLLERSGTLERSFYSQPIRVSNVGACSSLSFLFSYV